MASPGKKKGSPRTGGRLPGSPNRVTKDIKLAFQTLVENNLDNMKSWMERIAVRDPEKAMEIMVKLTEYCIPKLARTEIKTDGDDHQLIITRKEISGPNAG